MSDSTETNDMIVRIITLRPGEDVVRMAPGAYKRLIDWFRVGQERTHSVRGVDASTGEPVFAELAHRHVVSIAGLKR